MSNGNPTPFSLLDEETAPAKSVPFLAQAKAAFGLIPNVEKVMSQAPSLLASYMTAWGEFNESSLSEVERQIVYQTVNFENNCQYCMPWHTILSEMAKMDVEDVEALRLGGALSNRKHEALRLFTQDLVRTNGSIAPHALKSFLESGYTERQALEVILGISVKTMSNFTNAIAQTPLDKEASHKEWIKPSLRG
ncbi:carboxymuconolactone decarboxylase family protein [Kiloniella majae]|uniref:carboxymuconolactone decarboxylase family protein n=1 Tax=Kiloniella majae TaxID=1938558 RepID=UPI000A27728A|nr:carboxymuconolactone decarboxylase family protein [Kiloniella majae]